MRHMAGGANIKVAECTRIRFYTQCGTQQVEPTSRSPSAHAFAFTHNAAHGRWSQHQGRRVHTHSLLRTMRHTAGGAHIKIAECTRIRFYAQCGTWQVEPTSRSPSAHTFTFTHNAAH